MGLQASNKMCVRVVACVNKMCVRAFACVDNVTLIFLPLTGLTDVACKCGSFLKLATAQMEYTRQADERYSAGMCRSLPPLACVVAVATEGKTLCETHGALRPGNPAGCRVPTVPLEDLAASVGMDMSTLERFLGTSDADASPRCLSGPWPSGSIVHHQRGSMLLGKQVVHKWHSWRDAHEERNAAVLGHGKYVCCGPHLGSDESAETQLASSAGFVVDERACRQKAYWLCDLCAEALGRGAMTAHEREKVAAEWPGAMAHTSTALQKAVIA